MTIILPLPSLQLTAWRNNIYPVFIFVLSLTIFSGMLNAQLPATSINSIKKAWQDREESIPALSAKWKQIRTQPKGYFDLMSGAKNPPMPSPPRDLRLKGTGMVLFDRHSLRYELTVELWSVRDNIVNEAIETLVHVNDKQTTLTSPVVYDNMVVTIHKKSISTGASKLAAMPIMCFARGNNSRFSLIDLDKFELTGKRPVMNGKRCVELVNKQRSNNIERVILLDPDRGYILMRYYTTVGGRVSTRLDITYSSNSDNAWLPSRWEYTATTPKTGLPLDSVAVVVTEFDVTRTVSEADFVLSLPPGAHVADIYSGEEMKAVVKHDGTIGPRLPASERPTYEQLAAIANKSNWPISIIVFIVCSIIITYIIVRRFRSRICQRSELDKCPQPNTDEF